MESAQSDIMMDGTWTTEGFTQANLDDIQNSLNVSFTFPLTQMGSALTSEDGMGNSTYDIGGLFDTVSPRSRYVSLDLGRSDMQDLQDSGFFLPLSKSKSLTHDAKENARERRRTQNRFAQRAYRQRKEQAIKDQEKEIEELKLQLAKEKKLNQALAKVIEFLKERLKGKQPAAAARMPATLTPQTSGESA